MTPEERMIRAAKLAAFYQRVEKGELPETTPDKTNWHSGNGPVLTSDSKHWRTKSLAKHIDMTPLCGSGIECEFTYIGMKHIFNIGTLETIVHPLASPYPYRGMNRDVYSVCRPILNKRTLWKGGKWPLHPDYSVKVYFRASLDSDGEIEHLTETDDASYFTWKHTGTEDIESYEILGFNGTDIYPWEAYTHL